MTQRQFESETKTAEPEHPSLRALCETRQGELKDALGHLGADGSPRTRRKWIESSKYLGAKEAREMAARPASDAKGGSS